MPSARTVVEDSDDDVDLLSPEKAAEEVDTIAVKRPANGTTNGTGSTERLKDDILKAHDALFASEPTRKHGLDGTVDGKAGIESPTARAKRRKTTSGMDHSTSGSVKLGRSKTVQTYGQSSGTGRSRMEEDFDAFEALKKDNIMESESDARNTAKVGFSPVESLCSSHEQQLQQDAAFAWDMRGSLLQDFAEHDPAAMFPSNAATGSTVPDNTNTQRRLIEEATRESGLGSLDQSPAVRSDGSLRSSAFRTTQATNKSPTVAKSSGSPQHSERDTRSSQLFRGTGSPLKQASNIDSQERPPPPLFDESPVKHLRRSQPVQVSPRPGPSTPKSRVIRSTTPQNSPPKHTTALAETETAGKERSPSPVIQNSSAKPSRKKGSRKSPSANEVDPPTENPAVVVAASKDQQQSDVAADNAPPHLPPPPQPVPTEDQIEQQHDRMKPIPAPAAAKKRKRKNELEALEKLNQALTHSDALNSDDIAAIGLPKEQYKPRPSRSRSAQVAPAAESDLSVNLEKAGKARNKRRKTADIKAPAWDHNQSPDKQKVEAILDMGFTPARAKKALVSSHGNLGEAIEELINVKPITNRTRADAAEAPLAQPTVKEHTVEKEIAAALKTYSPERHRSATPAEQEQRQAATARKVVVTVQVPSAKSAKCDKDEAPLLCNDEPQASPTSDVEVDDSLLVKKGRGRPKKIKPAHEVDEPTIKPEAESEADECPVVKRRPGRPKKPAPRVLTEDEAADIEAGLDPDADAHKQAQDHAAESSEAEPPKRRGRGRQKCVQSTEALVDVYHDNPEAPESKAIAPAKVLRELDTNTRIDAEAGTPLSIEPKKGTQTATPTSSPAGLPAPTTPTPAKQKASDASSAQHSPLSKGKVPYRVGLTRKARIPSLLKVIRK